MFVPLLACTASPVDTSESADSNPVADSSDSAVVADSSDTGPMVIEDPCPTLGADHDCCRDWTDYLWACRSGLAGGQPVEGSFVEVVEGATRTDWVFLGTDGEEYRGEFLGGTPRGLLPDLEALGTVTVTDDGGCETDGEGAARGSFVVVDADGALVIAIGSAAAPEADPVSVSYDEDDGSCPVRPSDGCFPGAQNHPVDLAYGGDTVTLYQGASAPLGEYDAYVFGAMFFHGPSSCDDVGGHAENWAILPR